VDKQLVPFGIQMSQSPKTFLDSVSIGQNMWVKLSLGPKVVGRKIKALAGRDLLYTQTPPPHPNSGGKYKNCYKEDHRLSWMEHWCPFPRRAGWAGQSIGLGSVAGQPGPGSRGRAARAGVPGPGSRDQAVGAGQPRPGGVCHVLPIYPY
jgi:hypothetical protein